MGELYAYYGFVHAARADFEDIIATKALGSNWDKTEAQLRAALDLDPFIISNGREDGWVMPTHLTSLGFKILTVRTGADRVARYSEAVGVMSDARPLVLSCPLPRSLELIFHPAQEAKLRADYEIVETTDEALAALPDAVLAQSQIHYRPAAALVRNAGAAEIAALHFQCREQSSAEHAL